MEREGMNAAERLPAEAEADTTADVLAVWWERHDKARTRGHEVARPGRTLCGLKIPKHAEAAELGVDCPRCLKARAKRDGKQKTMHEGAVTHAVVDDAVRRFLARGGIVRKLAPAADVLPSGRLEP